VDRLPFIHVEHEGFHYFYKALNHRFLPPWHPTATRDCYLLYIDKRKKLVNFFGNMTSRVCLTTDTWTPGQNLSYMCLTAHFMMKIGPCIRESLTFVLLSVIVANLLVGLLKNA